MILLLGACGDSGTSQPTNAAAGNALASTTVPVVPTTPSQNSLATTTTSASTPKPTVAKATSASSTNSSGGDVAKGRAVFEVQCQGCHPEGGQQAGFGPNLSTSPRALDPAYVTGNVRNGRGEMPPFDTATVSDTDLTNIIAYLKSIHK